VPSYSANSKPAPCSWALDIAGDLTAEAEVDAETLFARE
jgi:hypothetical protein